MKPRDAFSILQKVEVFDENRETGQRRIFRSRVEDVGEKSLTIAAPFAGGYFLPPRYGRPVTARVSGGGCSYVFKFNLLSHSNEPLPLWRISMPEEIERIQMRSFVRLDITMDVNVEVEEHDEDYNLVINSVDTLTKDISAGGVRIVLNKPFSVDAKTRVSLPLDGENVVVAEGKVIRVVPPEGDYHKYEAVIEFTKIDEKSRGMIVKYIFKKQIERRKKEEALFKE